MNPVKPRVITYPRHSRETDMGRIQDIERNQTKARRSREEPVVSQCGTCSTLPPDMDLKACATLHSLVFLVSVHMTSPLCHFCLLAAVNPRSTAFLPSRISMEASAPCIHLSDCWDSKPIGQLFL